MFALRPILIATPVATPHHCYTTDVPPPPPPLPPSCTPRHPVRPVRCIERATTFHRIYRSTEAPGATRFGRQVYQQLVTTTSAGDINSDSIVVSRSAAPAGINIKLTLRSSSPSPRSIELRVSSPACSRRHPPDSFPIIRTIHRIFARNLSSWEEARRVERRTLVSACRGFLTLNANDRCKETFVS